MIIDIEIRREKALLAFLGGLQKKLDNMVGKSMAARVKGFVLELTAYPPGGNLPMYHGRQWIRGVGLINVHGDVLRPSYQYGGGNLGGWQVNQTLKRNEQTYHLVARAPYAGWVSGDDFQTYFHRRTGWKRVTPTLERHGLILATELEEGVNQLLGGAPK